MLEEGQGAALSNVRPVGRVEDFAVVWQCENGGVLGIGAFGLA